MGGKNINNIRTHNVHFRTKHISLEKDKITKRLVLSPTFRITKFLPLTLKINQNNKS